MILVIPAIDLLEEHCVRRAGRRYVREKEYFDDPVKMARLWRLQNARTLHVSGHDQGDFCRRSILRDICDAVDIPVQLAGGFYSDEDVDSAFRAGVYRIVLDVASYDDLPFFTSTLQRIGVNRVVACIRARDGLVSGDQNVSAVDIGKELERIGCRRIIYSDVNSRRELTDRNIMAYRRLGQSLNRIRITALGGVSDYSDLIKISDLHPIGVDSVVIGKALYENRFPCQQFWCWNYLDKLDLTQFTTARLAE